MCVWGGGGVAPGDMGGYMSASWGCMCVCVGGVDLNLLGWYVLQQLGQFVCVGGGGGEGGAGGM